MSNETLLLSPLASVRTLGAVIPAVLDEDPEGARAALSYATQLAQDLSQWADYPFQGPDAALNRIARLVRDRTATTALTRHDVMMLTNAIFESRRILAYDTLQSKAVEVRCFNTAASLIEEVWRDDAPR